MQDIRWPQCESTPALIEFICHWYKSSPAMQAMAEEAVQELARRGHQHVVDTNAVDAQMDRIEAAEVARN